MKFSTALKKFLLALAAFIIVFLVLEGLARIAETIVNDVRRAGEKWYVYSPELGWERKPDFNGPVYSTRREFDSRGFISVDTAQIKDRAGKKVLCVGDSKTFGNKVPVEATFAEVADDLLPDVAVINLGVPGYSSFQGYKTLLRYLPELKPDIVVISFNYNDRRYVLNGAEVDGDAKFRRMPLQHALDPLLENICLYRSLRTLCGKLGIVPQSARDSHRVNKPARLDALPVRVGPEKFRENLKKMAGLAKENGAAVIFLLLKDNPVQTEYLRQGMAALEESRYEEAIGYLRMAVTTENVFADLARINLARAYGKKGLVKEAEETLTVDRPFRSLHGGTPLYPDTDYNRIMREVAEEYGAVIVDAGQVLDEHFSDYYDFCHFDANGHRRVALLLRDAISGMLSPENAPGFPR